jgi:hypothetical protein
MEWRIERPTRHGVYWFCGSISSHGRVHVNLPDPVLVRISGPRRVTPNLNSLGVIELEPPYHTDSVDHWDGEWAGPIETPRR